MAGALTTPATLLSYSDMNKPRQIGVPLVSSSGYLSTFFPLMLEMRKINARKHFLQINRYVVTNLKKIIFTCFDIRLRILHAFIYYLYIFIPYRMFGIIYTHSHFNYLTIVDIL